MKYSIFSLVSAFILTVMFLPVLIKYMIAHKEGQEIRDEGPKWHAKKSGTPTMGGTIFVIVSALTTLWFGVFGHFVNTTMFNLIIALLGYGLIGFLDDYLKLHFKRNLGLRAWQKLVLQIIVGALIFALAVQDHFEFALWLPMVDQQSSLILFAAFAIFWLVGFSNAVNLSDGIDGLATGLSMIAYASYAYLAFQTKNLAALTFALSLVGSLCGFLVFNKKPAKIFMGDAGSLALGGGLAALSIMLNRPWSLLLIGIVFVIETLSVMMQVTSFKLTGKRIFKMTPIHHHFELLGWSEWKIDIVFWLCGLLASVIYIVVWG